MIKTFENKTNQYQLVGNCEDIILTGSEIECQNQMDLIQVENSKWAVIHLVGPNTTVQCNLVESKVYDDSGINIMDLFAK